ncbi:hypothetical protein Poli38472_001273 [Pythium oligandrum]|uniref:Carbonic anhydrase n=1 Tax=Pythium oligandrum TaxID=41045 RepID=A0A8K1CUJ7_PYTOL|nr:hypothetical protein Poli38472_001273 [Pythium oligandrum]|eukprot:TMW69117.1 hypothetical protein Poli38472_001273 [Pythium oligandrum]
MRIFPFVFIVVALVSAAANADMTDNQPPWGYDQDNADVLSPDEWSTAYPTCAGQRQSPIDIDASAPCDTQVGNREVPLQFNGTCSDFHLKQHDDTYKGEVLEGSTCTVTAGGSKPYSLLQFHMHAPSEHTLNGKHYDAEAHFVHKNEDGLLVVGLFIEMKDDVETNTFLKQVWHQLDDVHANKSASLELSSYSDLLYTSAKIGPIFNYPGSLTTPPCDEIVDWWVLCEPVLVSTDDFDHFMLHTIRLPALDDGEGSRPTQPLNGRQVMVY